MKEQVKAEVFIIGNELLNGEIQDTNTHWLCREITGLGGHVVRGTILRDDLEVIAAELQSAQGRGTRVIFTSAGLGPTADDLTPSREKMAWLSQGAIPLYNTVGTLPCTLLRAGQSVIISLPGIPKELEGIFNSSLQPLLQETFRGGISVMRTITVCCNDESVLEAVLSRVVPDHSEVYIKCLATMPGETPELDITLTAVGSDGATLELLVDSATRDLTEGLSSLGFVTRDKQRNS